MLIFLFVLLCFVYFLKNPKNSINLEPMKIYKNGKVRSLYIYVLVLFIPAMMFGKLVSSSPSKILVITGGHAYDTSAFNQMLERAAPAKFDMLSQPEANKALAKGKINTYETVIFYDMWQEITAEQKKAFRDLTDQGTGLVFLHHSLVSYQEWDAFKKIIGGRYRQQNYVADSENASGYTHGIEMTVSVMGSDHPVTNGMNTFSIVDEGYSNIQILSSVKPLLKVEHPQCSDTVAWTNTYRDSRIVYILLGHDNKAYKNKNYRQLLSNAIEWVSVESK